MLGTEIADHCTFFLLDALVLVPVVVLGAALALAVAGVGGVPVMGMGDGCGGEGGGGEDGVEAAARGLVDFDAGGSLCNI
jgi:hypothetical protein